MLSVLLGYFLYHLSIEIMKSLLRKLILPLVVDIVVKIVIPALDHWLDEFGDHLQGKLHAGKRKKDKPSFKKIVDDIEGI